MTFYGKAADYSFSRPSVPLMKQVGVRGVIRYLRGAGKAVTASELRALIDAGIAFALVDETDITAFRGGYNAGYAAGKAARAALNALGNQLGINFDTMPIYTGAYDTYIAPGSLDWTLAIAFMRGFRDAQGFGPQGAYGEMTLLNELHREGLTNWEWESESRAFPGNAIDDPNAEIIQRFSHTLAFIPASQIDEDDLFATDWGQYPRPTATPKPNPTPKPGSQRVVPLHDGAAHDNGRRPYAIISPKDPTVVLSLFTTGFKTVTGKTSVTLGVQTFKMDKPADFIGPDPETRDADGNSHSLFVRFIDNTTGVIDLADGVTA